MKKIFLILTAVLVSAAFLLCYACTGSDLSGTYEGILPCADCPGLHTIITINSGGTFHMEENYLERSEEPLITEGSWAVDGEVITFNNGDYSFEYKVVSDKEIRWAPGGEEITDTDLNWSLLKQ